MSSPVHHQTSSINVLLFPRKHFPSISPSIVARTTLPLLFQWQYLENFRCLICSKMPFSSGIPIFSQIHVLVFRSVQLILSIWRHTHISKAVSNAIHHLNDDLRCLPWYPCCSRSGIMQCVFIVLSSLSCFLQFCDAVMGTWVTRLDSSHDLSHDFEC